MTLFDPGPATPEPNKGLSYGRRLTIRHQEMLDRGIHPATRQPLLDRVAAAVLAGVLIVAVLAAPADTPDIVDQRAPDVSAEPYMEEQP